jgi:2-phosphosulfolactate phosphatase
MYDWFEQKNHTVRLEWGRAGARRAAVRGDILVVVDVLSFSSLVVTAVAQGAIIYPCATQSDAENLATQIGAKVAVHRRDVPSKGQFSLSPPTFLGVSQGTKVTVASPNGATCSRFAESVPCLVAGALLNAAAVAAAVSSIIQSSSRGLTVLACGERWGTPNEDGDLRVAVEDFLGAGAIIAHLPQELSRSPEARVAESGFAAVCNDLDSVLHECGSGIELIDKGYEGDVSHAARLNVYTKVPKLEKGAFVNFEPSTV